MRSTYKIICNGRVQGVGFRPYVSKLAKSMGLSGHVSNNEDGVIIYVSGETKYVKEFYRELIENPPPVAIIKTHQIIKSDWVKYERFEILPTQTKGKLNLALTPDFAICEICSEEISDPENRRYRYPFTTLRCNVNRCDAILQAAAGTGLAVAGYANQPRKTRRRPERRNAQTRGQQWQLEWAYTGDPP